MKTSLTNTKAKMESKAEKEANSTRYVVLSLWYHETNKCIYSTHPYAVVLYAREAFEEVMQGDLHVFKHKLAKKCAKNESCDVVNLVSQVKDTWISTWLQDQCIFFGGDWTS